MMEGPLNLAHQQQRKAEYFLKSGKFLQSIECHQKAAELLTEAMSLAHCEKIRESLELQKMHNLRQQAIVKYKQQNMETHMKNQRNSKQLKENDVPPSYISNSVFQMEEIRQAIYHTIEEQDSLLHILLQSDRSESELCGGTIPLSQSLDSIIKKASKNPKDDKTRIEELQINNEELKKLVFLLLTELESYRDKAANLQQTVDDLKRRLKFSENNHVNTTVINSSSPYVFSPVSEFSPGGSLRDLPALAPLELPNVDFSALEL